MNAEKTDGGELVTGYECSPDTADMEFLLAKAEYTTRTGRDLGEHDIIAYHVRQAFAPGEIDAKTANESCHHKFGQFGLHEKISQPNPLV